MSYISNITRPAGDPKVLQSGRSSLGAPDRLGRALGWFSIGLGVTELLAPRRITEALGLEGKEGLVRAYGAREIGSGVLSLSIDKDVGLWSRVAGDALDIATVASALRPGNRKIGNVLLTLAMLAGITAIDVAGAEAVTVRHKRKGGSRSQYSDRSGFPQGLAKARGAARDSRPQQRPTAPRVAQASGG
jgi:hypothetical protein